MLKSLKNRKLSVGLNKKRGEKSLKPELIFHSTRAQVTVSLFAYSLIRSSSWHLPVECCFTCGFVKRRHIFNISPYSLGKRCISCVSPSLSFGLCMCLLPVHILVRTHSVDHCNRFQWNDSWTRALKRWRSRFPIVVLLIFFVRFSLAKLKAHLPDPENTLSESVFRKCVVLKVK